MNHLTRALAVLALTAGIAAAQEGSVGYTPGQRGTAEGLRAWLAEFAPRALAAGISAPVLDPALASITFLPDVVEKDRRQDEFTRAIWDYMDRAVSDDRIALGRKAMIKNKDLLDRIEGTYGVDAAYALKSSDQYARAIVHASNGDDAWVQPVRRN